MTTDKHGSSGPPPTTSGPSSSTQNSGLRFSASTSKVSTMVYEAVENPPSMSAGHPSHRTLRLDIPKFKQPGLTRDQTKNPPSITLGDPPPVQVPLCVHKMRPWDGIKPGAPYYCHNFQGWLTSSRVQYRTLLVFSKHPVELLRSGCDPYWSGAL
ncbi:MAG: hypothetical protein J3Q66DRAFT_390710 [Benniella sp.]|nr:MAG: hypothetical protein J3Q66DRAFT_390710 [Benniella sp.]